MDPRLSEILTQESLSAAPQLLGWQLVRNLPKGQVRLKIVETEAYHQDDPASHSFRGRTSRTSPMFEAGGLIYVYFTYGMHYCVNIVTGQVGRGEAVLLRAAEPIEGIEILQANCGRKDITNIANGPAKLAQAIGINDTGLSGTKLDKKTFWLEPPDKQIMKEEIIIGPRIGISRAIEAEARFYIKDNPFVSKL